MAEATDYEEVVSEALVGLMENAFDEALEEAVTGYIETIAAMQQRIAELNAHIDTQDALIRLQTVVIDGHKATIEILKHD